MAIDKAVDSGVLEAGLKKIADAIRAKGGTSDSMAFPDGFASLIEAIESGGGDSDSLFHTTITPAAAGEVVTVELAARPRIFKAVIVISQSKIPIKLYYPYVAVAYIYGSLTSTGYLSSTFMCCGYRDNLSLSVSHGASAFYRTSVPSGGQAYNGYTLWCNSTDIPVAKFLICDGTEKKYGILLGETYDIWAIF